MLSYSTVTENFVWAFCSVASIVQLVPPLGVFNGVLGVDLACGRSVRYVTSRDKPLLTLGHEPSPTVVSELAATARYVIAVFSDFLASAGTVSLSSTRVEKRAAILTNLLRALC